MAKSNKPQDSKGQEGGIISEMMISSESSTQTRPQGGDLLGEGGAAGDDDSKKFGSEVAETLQKVEVELQGVVVGSAEDRNSWTIARETVERFRPVPWFIWRLSNFVLGRPGRTQAIPEGLVLGLRRLLFAAASDPVLGAGRKVNSVREALSLLSPDSIAAIAVIHAVCRRLATQQHERIWRPILDDAILRAQIGLLIMRDSNTIGPGRGMLAGFAGRSGLAIQIALGDINSARHALEQLAAGTDLSGVGLKLYGAEPLQVSAMVLSAAGCGRDAAFGTASYGAVNGESVVSSPEQRQWLHAFSVVEYLRVGRLADVPQPWWDSVGTTRQLVESEVSEAIKKSTRRGHGWNWVM